MPTKTTVVRSAGSALNAKIRCGEDVRRVTLDAEEMNLERLLARLTVMFNLEGMTHVTHGGTFRIKYQDDEGDLVSITDDEELQAAFDLAKDWGASPCPRKDAATPVLLPHLL